MLCYVMAAFLALFVIFLWWRYTSVDRGCRRQAERVLKQIDPLARRIAANQPLTPDDVRPLAAEPSVRPMLYVSLSLFGRLDLFPPEHLTRLAQAQGILAYWLMHPNEAQDAPEAVELVEAVTRQVDGEDCEFFALRYRMPEGHWAAKDGWMLGIAGPFRDADSPYADSVGAFARFDDEYGTTQPDELVTWYIDTLR